MHKIRTFFRLLLLLHDKSDQPTGLLPLETIQTAVVLRDPEEQGTLDREIRNYFKRRGMAVRLLSRCDSRLRSKEELFISLVTEGDLNELYAAVSSHAKFKIGTHQVKGGIYDLVVSPSKSGETGQSTLFRTITDLLEKIK